MVPVSLSGTNEVVDPEGKVEGDEACICYVECQGVTLRDKANAMVS